MKPLNVFIEINGTQCPVGSLEGNDYRDAHFKYSQDYLNAKEAAPISISLPLQKESFSAEATRSFFEALLPEGFSRKAVSGWIKADEDDYISLLRNLGKECIGAIQITDDERISESGYIPVEKDELISLAREGATKSTELLAESHISLAGASGKVGLYYDELQNKWYKPFGIAASTHILKQSHVRLDHLVVNEQLCMLTASKLNIEVPDSFIVNTGTGNDDEILYATERFDRIRRTDLKQVASPYRLHQEDFGQALGIPSEQKYETENRGYLKKIFSLINNYSSNPIEDGLKLWDRVVFNYILGNTDAHIKNYGLLYSSDLKSIRLSPAYDLICTRIYGNRNDMSVMIDGEIDSTKLTRRSFENAAHDVAIGPKMAMDHFDYIKDNFETALHEAAEEMRKQGIDDAVEMADRILKSVKTANST